MINDARTAWTTPELTRLSISLDTALTKSGSSADGYGVPTA
jgi:hypothetical protein